MTKKVKLKTNFGKNSFDFLLCITVLLLLGTGLIMVLSASSPSALAETGNDSYLYFRKQGIFAGIGIIAMLFISKIDYRKYKNFYKIAYWGSVCLLLLVLVPGIGKSVNGAKRWVSLGIQFQPSELAKIGLIVYYAAYLSINKKNLKGIWNGFLKPLIPLAIPIGILFGVQDHLSASIVIIAVVSIMMLIIGCKLRYFLTAGVLGASAIGFGMLTLAKATGKGSFRIARLTSFLNPWQDAQGSGWQIIQSLYAIGSGGLFGVGLGESKQKYLYISEPHNDFIFAVIAEELGFIGCLLVITLFAIFIWRGIVIAMKAPDTFGSLLAVGITSLIGLQAIINIAVVTSSMPVTGMALPFFSYGGTSLLILLCGVRCIIKYIEVYKENLINFAKQCICRAGFFPNLIKNIY